MLGLIRVFAMGTKKLFVNIVEAKEAEGTLSK